MATNAICSPPLTTSVSSSSSKNLIFTKKTAFLASPSSCSGMGACKLAIKKRSGERFGMVKCMASAAPSVLPKALLFDCDGVLVDTEKDGHRVSFNDTFAEKELGFTWDVDLYGELLKIGGGKERMMAYFNKVGWPEKAPTAEQDRKEFIASLHKRKTELFMALIEKKLLPLRPGVAKLVNQALGNGVKVAVCSTSNEKAVSAVVSFLLGAERAEQIQIYAGDVVPRKKPDPAIYLLAAETLGVEPSSYVVIEDSGIGLAAAKAAGMKCIVTKSRPTKQALTIIIIITLAYFLDTGDEDFAKADAVFDFIRDQPEERFDLAFSRSLLEKQYVNLKD